MRTEDQAALLCLALAMSLGFTLTILTFWLTDDPEVAGGYRKALTPPPSVKAGDFTQPKYAEHVAERVYKKMVDAGADPSEGLKDEIGRQTRNRAMQLFQHTDDPAAQGWLSSALKNSKKGGWDNAILEEMNELPVPKTYAPQGSMYQVEIDASPDEFLDWDLPLSEQSEGVRGAVSEYMPERGMTVTDADWSSRYVSPSDDVSGSAALQLIGKGAESRLASKGIKGIRYKDGNSRGKEGGTSNYVVFDENLISIARKYGIAIPAAAAMLARQTGQNPQDLYEDDSGA